MDEVREPRGNGHAGLGDRLRQTSSRLGGYGRELRERARLAAKRLRGTRGNIESQLRDAVHRSVSHPTAIEIQCEEKKATLRGGLVADEAADLLARVAALRGLEEIHVDLQLHGEPFDRPELRAASGEAPQKARARGRSWPVGKRLAAVLGGGALVTWGLVELDPLGWALGAVGAGLMTRAFTNRPLAELAFVRKLRARIEELLPKEPAEPAKS